MLNTLWLYRNVGLQGFLVVSMEHTDGSGSAVRVPYIAADGKSIRTRWLFYQGISKDTHSMKIAHRVQELQSCRDVLEALDSGEGRKKERRKKTAKVLPSAQVNIHSHQSRAQHGTLLTCRQMADWMRGVLAEGCLYQYKKDWDLSA